MHQRRIMVTHSPRTLGWAACLPLTLVLASCGGGTGASALTTGASATIPDASTTTRTAPASFASTIAGPVSPAASHRTPQDLPFEMISGGHINDLIAAGLTNAEQNYYFNQPNAYINMSANGATLSSAQVAAEQALYPKAKIGWLFNSYGMNCLTGNAGLHKVLSSPSTLPAGLAYIAYDPEGSAGSGDTNGTPGAGPGGECSPGGNGTPSVDADKLEAGETKYVSSAASLVHAAGLKFFFIPAVDVGMTSGSSRSKYSTWLSQRRGEWSALGEDMYSIQSQQALGTPTWATFVPSALAQSLTASPTTSVGIGLGINPSSPATSITTVELLAGYKLALANGASGIWENVEVGVNADVSASVYVGMFNGLYP